MYAASDPAQNAYFQRDYRCVTHRPSSLLLAGLTDRPIACAPSRRYPRLDVITQQDLSALLLAQPEALGK